ncbi:tetratricopeptide repeat protein [Amaricoccus solimangrovi]|uniref:Tetratricopeptide repeat protein 38 n=1 Tax=Amaricoccus solimangrovi TaxID=2589815 RepID=A0A501WMH0_9RHOB|nr:tetratricopeptide repeat protein [Amaricoccus solimangrovi]TPE48181.1 tetratricopeptide repeat protein [Amaricoccus solimangrovi]
MRPESPHFETSTESGAARKAFDEAVHGLAAHRPTTAGALATALRADPDHVAAHALTGFANLILARSELVEPAGQALGRARAALAARDGGTADERALVGALGAAVAGSFSGAADRLDAGFADRPAVLLPFKLAHALRFMLGDAKGMLAASGRAMAIWDPEMPGAGFLLGCHAFALEEHGFYDAARAAGESAVALQPDDAWGLHAVGHVHEMRGDTGAGIAWIEASRASWSRCNNFSFHMAWHLALFHLERGDTERVLRLYDAEVRPAPTDDFRDMANAVSLLWRLERRGAPVGHRWRDLAEIALRRRADATLVFGALHTLTALVALGEWAAARELVAALEARARGTGDQARVAAGIGVPLAHVLLGRGSFADRQALDAIATRLPGIGGSNAQRDVFVLAIAEAAGRRGDAAALTRIGRIRRHLKAEDRLIRSIERGARA